MFTDNENLKNTAKPVETDKDYDKYHDFYKMIINSQYGPHTTSILHINWLDFLDKIDTIDRNEDYVQR